MQESNLRLCDAGALWSSEVPQNHNNLPSTRLQALPP